MRALGDVFERRACTELERAGLKLLDRSYSTRFGELDLVMCDGDTIVFVEVRYRKHAAHGTAAESVTVGKRLKLIKAAQLWLAANPKKSNASCRFDVITYDGPRDAAHAVWLRGAFET
ncbi:putative endonuclease [Rhodanobacter sp. ANJX3]|uniref:YraN family protein n=1 Tax=Rhodanobacter sp. ANJX3 TaxID=2723083 RepID=UPI00161686A5|nr:YraN family protein [Rhodanobacter sp. ANJX3]MBB5359126.1 putative endonuclease [Rhodanobacter sp. ANJX3]